MRALTWVCFHHYLFLGYVLNVFSCLHGILGLNADTLTPIAALGYIRTRSPVSWEFYCCKLNVKDLDVVVRQRSDFFVSLWAWPGTCRTAFSQTLHSVSNCCLQIRVLFFFKLVELNPLQHSPPKHMFPYKANSLLHNT